MIFFFKFHEKLPPVNSEVLVRLKNIESAEINKNEHQNTKFIDIVSGILL